ncbi:unnamed protein product, partial [Cladocopium goreaui]
MKAGPSGAAHVTVAWDSAAKSTEDTLHLAHLTHAVLANVEEKIRIEFSELRLDHGIAAEHLRCKAYVGPQAALTEGDGPDKSRLREIRLEFSGPKAVAEVPIGIPHAQEPWAIRIKLYRRPASNLFAQEIWYEVVAHLPLSKSRVSLTSEIKGRYGDAMLEVLRLVPRSALPKLQHAAGGVLTQAISAGVEASDVEKICLGLRELGPETMTSSEAGHALEAAAKMGNRPVVDLLLMQGVPATLRAAHAAEQGKAGKHSAEMAKDLFMASQQTQKLDLLPLAIEERMPLVAERLLLDGLAKLDSLPGDGSFARKAHAAGAWTVLAALLERGDPMPCKPRLLLDYALRAGHAGLARSCLKHMGEDTKDMDTALRTCLDHGRTEIVREALEVMWKARSSQWSDGPPLLTLEVGPSDQPAECSICFESLYTNPGVFVNEEGLRVCGHFTCLTCAEHVQDEASERFRAWRTRREPRIPKPPGPACPLCRASFAAALRLTDPTVDPKSFFRLACVLEPGEDIVLKDKYAMSAIEAILPVNASTFAPIFEELWPQWCADCTDGMREADFLRPDGMLAWLSSHLLEMKVEGQLGAPPKLSDTESWFQYFDYHGNGRLSKSELLRGIVKAYDVAQLVPATTPSRKSRTMGAIKLRELVDALWDEDRWGAGGIGLEDFAGRCGLAQRLLDAMPDYKAPVVRTGQPERLSVDEALAKARQSDFQTIEEDEARAKERAEKQRRQIAPAWLVKSMTDDVLKSAGNATLRGDAATTEEWSTGPFGAALGSGAGREARGCHPA